MGLSKAILVGNPYAGSYSITVSEASGYVELYAMAKSIAWAQSRSGVYAEIYRLYKQLHDALGVAGHSEVLSNVMKDLLAIKERANA